MRDIKQIRELNEMDDSQIRKLTALARAGLFDIKKINFIKRALDKDVSKMTQADKKALIELLDSLMAEVLGSTQIYSKVKQEVMKESKDYLTKYDPRYEKNYPSDRDLPHIIILKRKAIRVYPDSQKVGLYYSQALDKYVSIPFGPGIPVVNEETELNEVSKGLASKVATARAAQALQASNDKTKKKLRKRADTASEYVRRKENIEREESKRKAETEKEAKRRITSMEVNPVVGAAALAGVGARKMFDKFRARRAEKKAAQAKSTEKTTEPKKDEAPKNSMSTSGIVSGKFATQQSASPSTVKIESKEQTKTEIPKSTSDQPDDSGLAAVSKLSSKTKTTSYQSHSAQAIPNIKHGAPKKAGGAFLIPSHPSRSTSAQPNVKPKALKVSLLKKMDEKRQEKIDEAVPLVPIALGAARLAAPAIGKVIGAGARMLGKGVKAAGKGAAAIAAGAAGGAATKDTEAAGSRDTTPSEPKLLTPSEFSLKASVNKPQSGGINSALRSRDVSLSRKVSQAALKESKIIQTLRSITEDVDLEISGNKITINSNMAEKVIKLYESLSKDNKKKMESLISESTDSFRKILNFAVEQV